MKSIPNIVWMYWHQGFVDSPELVKMCFYSWKIRNPDFEIKFLDQDSIHKHIAIPDYINLFRNDITHQKYANHIRLNLLKKFGGIWVDANIYCFRPLNEWLNMELLEEGIFMFSNPFPDRIIANWFIASSADNYIIKLWSDSYNNYFKKNNLINTYTKFGKKLRRKIRARSSSNIEETKVWFSVFIRKVLKISPYLVMHYLFNKLYLNNQDYKRIWDRVQHMNSCKFDLRCQRIFNKKFSELEDDYMVGKLFLLKLSHRIDPNAKEFHDQFLLIENDYKKLVRIPH